MEDSPRSLYPQAGKDDYPAAKTYWAISLLNYLDKMIEKVAAMLVSAYCEARSTSHPGQYGCRTQRPAVDQKLPRRKQINQGKYRRKRVGTGRLALRPSFLHHANPILCRC